VAAAISMSSATPGNSIDPFFAHKIQMTVSNLETTQNRIADGEGDSNMVWCGAESFV
jgi:hypothetical protein